VYVFFLGISLLRFHFHFVATGFSLVNEDIRHFVVSYVIDVVNHLSLLSARSAVTFSAAEHHRPWLVLILPFHGR